MRKFIQTIEANNGILFLSYLIAIGLGSLSYISSSTPHNYLILASLALVLLLNLLLLNTIYKVNSVKVKGSNLPLILFILFTLGNLPPATTLWGIALPLLLTALLMVFNSYTRERSETASLLLAILTAGVSIHYPIVVWYIPLFLVGLITMEVLSIKSFLAFILGLIAPYWIVAATHLLGWNGFDVEGFYHQLALVAPPTFTPLFVATTLHPLVIGLVAVCCAFSNLTSGNSYKIQVRLACKYSILVLIYSMVLATLYHHHNAPIVGVIYGCAALQIGRFLIDRCRSKVATILSVFLLLFNLLLYLWICLPL